MSSNQLGRPLALPTVTSKRTNSNLGKESNSQGHGSVVSGQVVSQVGQMPHTKKARGKKEKRKKPETAPCEVCKKPVIVETNQFIVPEPGTSRVFQTCSPDCQQRLLKDMISKISDKPPMLGSSSNRTSLPLGGSILRPLQPQVPAASNYGGNSMLPATMPLNTLVTGSGGMRFGNPVAASPIAPSGGLAPPTLPPSSSSHAAPLSSVLSTRPLLGAGPTHDMPSYTAYSAPPPASFHHPPNTAPVTAPWPNTTTYPGTVPRPVGPIYPSTPISTLSQPGAGYIPGQNPLPPPTNPFPRQVGRVQPPPPPQSRSNPTGYPSGVSSVPPVSSHPPYNSHVAPSHNHQSNTDRSSSRTAGKDSREESHDHRSRSAGSISQPKHSPHVVLDNSISGQVTRWLKQRDSLPQFWRVRSIVLDTNVLLSEDKPDIVFELHNISPDPDTKFIVPYVLVQELDALKARWAGPHHAARRAITRLYDALVQKGSQKSNWIRGQKPDERLPVEGALSTTSGDDRILECTNYFHRYSPPPYKAMLLTNDKNLQLKATFLGMITGNLQSLIDFYDGFASLKKERDLIRAQIKVAQSSSKPLDFDIPDFKLEDYDGPEPEEEEDEFQKMRKASGQASSSSTPLTTVVIDKSKTPISHAELLERVPPGTKTNLWDESSSESESESSSSSSRSASTSNGKRNHKKRSRSNNDNESGAPSSKRTNSHSSDAPKEIIIVDD